MTSHKRKASQELSRSSVNLEALKNALKPPVPAPEKSTASWWSWVTELYRNIFAPYTQAQMPPTREEVIPHNQLTSFEHAQSRAKSPKRQMVRRSKPARSMSSSFVERRKAGKGKLNVEGCTTEKDYEDAIEDFFAPPELGYTRPTAAQSLITPEPSEASSDEEQDQGYSRRRQSVEVMCPSSSTASFPSPAPSPIAHTLARLPRIPSTYYETKPRHSITSDETALTKQLEALLVTPDEENESRLGVSTLMRDKLARRARELQAKRKAETLRASRERRLARRYPTLPLIQSLSTKWDERVHQAHYESSHQEVLTKAIRGTELHKKDFHTLLGHHAWLNDEIINAYLEWIEDAANKAATAEAEGAGERPSDVPKFIAHNSFFYETIKTKGPNATDRLMKRKKAAGKSFMQVDSMFVPINSGAHWTIAIVRPVAKTIEYLDSMGGQGQAVTRLLRGWLKSQLGSLYVEDDWTIPKTGCAVQNNGYDCGVFVCTNALCVALGLDTSCYVEPDMTQQRKNIAAVLINRGFVGEFAWEMMSGL